MSTTMTNGSKAYRALYGCEARSDWLTYIVNTIEAISRQRLLQFEIANFQAYPSTAEEQRLFNTFVRGEERQIEDAQERMAGALQDILDMGEDYVDSLRGVEAHLLPTLTPTSAESGRHVPIIGPAIQSIILDMALRGPRPDELARLGMTIPPAQGGRLQSFGADRLRHSIAAQRCGFCICGSQVVRPYQPRYSSVTTDSEISDAAATQGTDSVEDDHTLEKISIVPGQDVDYEAVSRQVDALLRLPPDAPMTAEQRHHKRMAQRFHSIVTAVNEAVLAETAGWKDDETRVRVIESRLREVLSSLPPGFILGIGSFCNDLALIARREKERERECAPDGAASNAVTGEHMPAEGEAGPSTGPGTLPHSNQEHQARVEDAREDSPDPVLISLPDSDSGYGSKSEDFSEHHALDSVQE